MKAKIDDLRFTYDGKQILSFVVDGDAREIVDEFKSKDLQLDIKEYKKKRSLDANAYAWVLIGKLAEKTNVPKLEVYRNAIKDVGGNYEVVCVQNKAVDTLCDGWQHNGLGWVTERDTSKIDGCTNVLLYYGSSTYDVAQMSRLIDLIVTDCKEVGIETMTPAELESLLGRWES